MGKKKSPLRSLMNSCSHAKNLEELRETSAEKFARSPSSTNLRGVLPDSANFQKRIMDFFCQVLFLQIVYYSFSRLFVFFFSRSGRLDSVALIRIRRAIRFLSTGKFLT